MLINTERRKQCMGIEYEIMITVSQRETLDRVLRSCPYFNSFEDQTGTYSFAQSQTEREQSIIPGVSASIESYGIYLVINTRSAITNEVFGFLMQRLSSLGTVIINEL
ncbi:MAG: hypothetical protein AB1489_39670 [Acidobacteriota bacterium]